MNRIPFGGEIRFITLSEVCLVCDAERGQCHAYGCFAEECPQCHGVLMTCHCRAISVDESQRHIQAICESFASIEEIQAIMSEPVTHEIQSFLFVAAWLTGMEILGFMPEKYDDLGDPMYSAKAVRSFFGESAHVL